MSVLLNRGQDGEVTLRAVVESKEYGREYFDGDESVSAMLKTVRRLIENAADDRIEWIIAIAFVPKDQYGSESGYGYGLELEDEGD